MDGWQVHKNYGKETRDQRKTESRRKLALRMIYGATINKKARKAGIKEDLQRKGIVLRKGQDLNTSAVSTRNIYLLQNTIEGKML